MLKQAPHTCDNKISRYILCLGFTRSEEDSNLSMYLCEGDLLILVLYVEDIFLTELENLIGMC